MSFAMFFFLLLLFLCSYFALFLPLFVSSRLFNIRLRSQMVIKRTTKVDAGSEKEKKKKTRVLRIRFNERIRISDIEFQCRYPNEIAFLRCYFRAPSLSAHLRARSEKKNLWTFDKPFFSVKNSTVR